MKQPYPFDPLLKHHLLIALLLAIWIFVFLYFTEPLDVNELNTTEKLTYLPAYGFLGTLVYGLCLGFQNWVYKRLDNQWTLVSEISFIAVFILISVILLRLFYLHFIIDWHPNAYTLGYHVKAIITSRFTYHFTNCNYCSIYFLEIS